MVLLRHLLGDALRRLRLRQGRTLREVSASARVSLGYLSEVERGQKEASSELLAAICSALGTPLSQVLREVSDNFALAELQSEPVFADVIEPALEVTTTGHVAEAGQVPVGSAVSARVVMAAASRLAKRIGTLTGSKLGAGQVRGSQIRTGQVPVAQKVAMSAGLEDPVFDQVARVARQITDMVPV